ncbi:MAG: MBOAT family protein [Candidatus Hydrogenedentota bacterium]|nr:MAG: MBOAT family protein [Candidatus Hydrogenedentota bacterium]
MLFNSFDFAIFLPIVFAVYWMLRKNLRLQNAFIVAASYIFYGWWDWRFLSLILLSTLIDYCAGRALSRTENPATRKKILLCSLVGNLGILGFFKYFNFFLDTFLSAFSFFGVKISGHYLNIILPVGISFYTFQTMSYTIDVFRRKMDACNNFLAFAAYVSFFPQLVAGPIERATHLLPQFEIDRHFDYSKSVDGLRQCLWGGFKKVVIADNCGHFVNLIYFSPDSHSGSTLFLATVLFSFQIYGDFSGYSDIAIGVSRLFGFDLRRNFAYPYFSRDIAEFWRRWHISLSTWFRDYLYIPLGGSRCNTTKKIRNTFAIFLVSGFWHGANWTFLAWGTLHACFFLPLLLANRNRRHLGIVSEKNALPSLSELRSIITTFALVTLGWVFFRSNSLATAMHILNKIFSTSLLSVPELPEAPITLFSLLAFLLIAEWIGRYYEHPLMILQTIPSRFFRYTSYYGLVLLILLFGSFDNMEFIYFQF